MLEWIMLIINRNRIRYVNKAFIILLILQYYYAIQLRVVSPTNHTRSREALYFAIKVVDYIDKNMSYGPYPLPPKLLVRETIKTTPSTSLNDTYELNIAINGASVYNIPMEKCFLDAWLGLENFVMGQNILQLQLRLNSTHMVLATEAIILYIESQRNDHFDVLLDFARSNPSHKIHYAYCMSAYPFIRDSFYGHSSQDLLDRFASLNGKRFEILLHSSIDASTTGDKPYDPCNHYKRSFKMVNCHHDLRALLRIPYVDFSFLLVDDEAANLSDFISLIDSVARITRRYLLLLAGKNLSREFYSTMKRYTYQANQQTFSQLSYRQESGELVATDILPGVTVWLLNTELYSNRFSDYVMRTIGREGDCWGATEGSPTDCPNIYVDNVNLTASFESRMLYESYKVSRSFMLLENVCYSDTDNFLISFSHDQNNSIINETFLAENEDYGFLYLNMRFLTSEINSSFYHEIFQFWPFVHGLSSLSTAVQPGHIAHELEPLLQFYHAFNIAEKTNDSELCSTYHNDIPLQNVALDELYYYVYCNLEHLLLSSMTSENSNDWTLSALGLLMKQWQITSSKVHRRTTHPQLLFRDHFFPPIDDDIDRGICFERLLVLGRSNHHLAFFGDKNLAARFQELAVDALTSGDDAISLQSPQRPNSSSLPLRERKLRVTLGIRAGPTRLIWNLKELIRHIRSTGLADEEWLGNHILLFDTMTFTEQVMVMRRTDIFIASHGAAILNGIFMMPGSVVIDLKTGPFYEFFFLSSLTESNVQYLQVPMAIPVNFTTQQADCPWHRIPKHCYSAKDVNVSGKMDLDMIRIGDDITCVGFREVSERLIACHSMVVTMPIRVSTSSLYSNAMTPLYSAQWLWI
jgi:hypothetical protein